MKRTDGGPRFVALAALVLVALACTCSPQGLLGDGGGGSLGDYVWLDSNGNGVQEGAEQGMPGVTVRLLNADGQVQDETTTDEDGLYQFVGVSAGTYQIEYRPDPGYNFTRKDGAADDVTDSDARQNDGRTDPFEYGGGEDDSWDAGLIPQESEPTQESGSTPEATEPPAATATPMVSTPEIFVTYEHTMPGSYSEIVIRLSGLTEGQVVEGDVLGTGVEGAGSFSVTADAEGKAEARVRITEYGTYEVDIPSFPFNQVVNVTADPPTATPES